MELEKLDAINKQEKTKNDKNKFNKILKRKINYFRRFFQVQKSL